MTRYPLVAALALLLAAATACTTSSPAATPSPPPPATATAATAVVPTRSPGSGDRATVVYRGSTQGKRVALTFDAGADPGFTAEILATLRAEKAPAAFGLTGRWAEQNPDLAKAIAAAGYTLINHTYDHASFTGLSTSTAPLSSAGRAAELERAESIVSGLTGVSTKPYFRPPYGDIDDSVARDVVGKGYTLAIMWTVDTLGWNGASADAIVQRSLEKAVPGAIYVMHVGKDSQDAAALPRVIEGLRAAGYTLVSLPDLLAG